MYRFYINNIKDEYHYMELARVFLPDDGFEIISYNGSTIAHLLGENSFFINEAGSSDRDEIKREMYKLLCGLTGKRPPWGTLTGVRPLKPALALCGDHSVSEMENIIRDKYLMSRDKSSLIADIADYQLSQGLGDPSSRYSIYVGIPFCPTRCAYCSFASNVASKEAHVRYLTDLLKEIGYMGELAKQKYTDIDSIYIGGGTPTTLSADQLSAMLDKISNSFGIDLSKVELTVEAGRPDTITEEKLNALKAHGTDRISINPQSMKDRTLELIGRNHTSDDIRQGFKIARQTGFDVINADLIAGLPEEELEDFRASLSEIIELGTENITIHTLSVKKGSRLKEHDPVFYRKNAKTVSDMLDLSRRMLTEAGYRPYYIYRQKHQIGALENVGWCLPGTHSMYNIRIMEDKQTIIGLGAGAVGKVYFPEQDRIERIANVSNYQIYSERFEEMLNRKKLYIDYRR